MKQLVAAVALALSSLTAVPPAQAAGLGRLTVLSSLGQPLRAEIELTSVTREEAQTLAARLASPEAFRQAGVDYNTALLGVRFAVQRRADGRYFINISSSSPINEPFVDLLVELNWATGRLVREYTFLLDPAELRGVSPPAAVVAPTPVPAPAPAAAAPAPVPAPAASAAPAPAASAPPPAPRPAASAPAPKPAPAPSKPAAGNYEVKRGDTLGRIARDNKPDGVSLEQMLVALLRSNPDAFVGGNMNRLKSGVILNLPDRDAASGVAAPDARRVVSAQAADWRAYTEKLAGLAQTAPAAKPDAPRQAAQGRITARVDDKAQKGDTKDQLRLSKADPTAKPKASVEDRVAKERELRDAKARAAELDKNVKDLQKLGEVKSQQLAELQKQAQAKAAPPAAPAADAKKAAEPAKAEAAKPAAAPAKADASKVEAPKAEPPKAAAPAAPPPVPAKAPEPPKAVEVAKAEPPKAAPVPARAEAPKAAEPAKAPEPPKAAEPAKAPEAAKAAPAKAPDPAKAADAPKAPADPAKGDAPKVADAAKADAPKPADAPKADEPPKAAEAPKPPPKKPAPPPPPPPPEPSLMDEFMDNPMYLAGGGGVLALLGGYAVYAVRRKRKVDKFENSIITGGDLKANSVFGNTGGQSVDTGNSSFQSDFSEVSKGSIDADEVDPVAEADVYMAYGRDAQAEEILKEALAKDATRHKVRVKLMEIYNQRGDAASFEAQAKELHAATGGAGEDWERAAELGRALLPGNALFGSGGASATTSTVTLPGGALAAAAAAASTTPLPVPAVEPVQSFNMESTMQLTPLQMEAAGATPEALTKTVSLAPVDAAPGADLDFDLGGASPAPADASAAATPDFVLDSPAAAGGDAGNVIDFDIGGPAAAAAPATDFSPGGTLIMEPSAGDTTMDETQPLPDVRPPDAPTPSIDFDFDLSADEAPAVPAASAAAPAGNSMDFDLSGVDLNLPGGGAPGGNDDAATKLDLAKAYQDMGDKEGARELLQEVAKEGSDAQKAEAQKLLSALG